MWILPLDEFGEGRSSGKMLPSLPLTLNSSGHFEKLTISPTKEVFQTSNSFDSIFFFAKKLYNTEDLKMESLLVSLKYLTEHFHVSYKTDSRLVATNFKKSSLCWFLSNISDIQLKHYFLCCFCANSCQKYCQLYIHIYIYILEPSTTSTKPIFCSPCRRWETDWRRKSTAPLKPRLSFGVDYSSLSAFLKAVKAAGPFLMELVHAAARRPRGGRCPIADMQISSESIHVTIREDGARRAWSFNK